MVTPQASVGIAELQRNAAKVVNNVRAGRAEYQVTRHGLPLGVAIVQQAPQPTVRRGVTMEQLLASPYYAAPRLDQATTQAWLQQLEEARNAAGLIELRGQ